MFATRGGALSLPSLTFVSQAAEAGGIAERYGLRKRLVPVYGIRSLRKTDMIHNNYQPKITVDPETYQVVADGELLTCEPAKILPMAQRYFLF
jgi:urease subunit alpha